MIILDLARWKLFPLPFFFIGSFQSMSCVPSGYSVLFSDFTMVEFNKEEGKGRR